MTPLPHDTGPQRRLQPLSRLAAATALLLGTVTAQAHHGWSWAEGEQMTLQGQIARISMAPPHPVLTVQAADGGRWQVDLGNPSQTERSGFTGNTAQVGDAITVRGNRSKDAQALHMKAVRITVRGKNYDMYPERIQD
jgi:hypothetical protein